ncbi:hypothetical protein L249_7400 [Ophiocordyceps polyrhachis-furcata BCC 54312]|uniref:Uncharacterized protein n=1 Tax=Ophiocordyceps polyrhachis-furcata BCC 54312 TaxID=1330021 RepID=A0A367LAA9_9HYPO|nr:hypothetical protein L249_7400 [Ophiocordyceps polyrhachis-furcata BCC 54312]
MIWEGIHAQSPMGIVIAARELGKSDFLSVGHDFSMRKNVGKKAMEEEEGGEKLVESYLRQEEEDELRDGGFVRIEEELKAGEVIVGKPPSFIDKFLNNKGTSKGTVGRYDRYWYSASIAVTITRADRCTARRSL